MVLKVTDIKISKKFQYGKNRNRQLKKNEEIIYIFFFFIFDPI